MSRGHQGAPSSASSWLQQVKGFASLVRLETIQIQMDSLQLRFGTSMMRRKQKEEGSSH